MGRAVHMRSARLRHRWGLASLLVCEGFAWSARAAPNVTPAVPAVAAIQQPDSPAPPYPAPRPEAGAPIWEISATPYLWMAGLKGDMAVSLGVPPVSVDASFGDIWGTLNIAGMAVVEARRDRFVATADLIYLDQGISKNIASRDSGFVDANLGSKMFVATVTAGFRVVDQGPFYVDLLGGARIVSQDMDLKLSGPNGSVGGSKSESWADPVVGARVQGPLGGKWSYAAYGDIGGFGVSSRLTWQLVGTVQYRVARRWNLSAGWRHLEMDYSNNGFVFDAAMDGPVLGASYRF